jgi:hypothetical protein
MRNRTLILVGLAVAVSLAAGAPVGSGSASPGSNIVLGSRAFAGHYGEGWGTARPRRLYNGGDPSGLVTEIRWTSWGHSTAYGYGVHSIFKPGGGYYPQSVIVELRAQNLGKCGSQPAYTRLYARDPTKPEGSLGPWLEWSEATTLCKFGF